ncbi:hypothetical protein HY494_03185 [Candidatus Woesearchaeota archaeon]|nr:hypothetical protein [Candidatus Woesearchaeota archaeon]
MEVATLHKQVSLKDKIVNLLTTEWPQSANDIYKAVKSDLGVVVSYQAVHKALKQLIDSGCLVVEDRQYRLSKSWIAKITKRVNQISSAYNTNFKPQSSASIILNGGVLQNISNDSSIRPLLLELINIYRNEFNPHNIFQKPADEVLTYLFEIQKEHELFVATLDGKVVGGTVLERKDKNIADEYKIWKLKHFALIEGLDSVAEQRIIADIETRLLTKSKKMKIQLNLAETEPRYIKMFKEYGFTQEATLEDRYRVGEKMFIYSKVY